MNGVPRDILRKIEKPARYLGGEWNQVDKSSHPHQEELINFAFCFPDIYEIGMSNLALRIIYHQINQREDAWCERVFSPAPDFRARLKDCGQPLFSLESGRSLSDFDILGITLQYELAYSAVLDLLDLGGVPVRASERGEGDPFVWGGGPVVVNVEPVAEFFDLFVLGEGEDVITLLLDLYQKWRQDPERKKQNFFLQAAQIPGIYVPSFYDVTYLADGRIEAVTPNRPGAPAFIRKQIIDDLDQAVFPERQIVPNIEIVHDRMYLELFRGCTRGCRFCQAGMIYRPVRERSAAELAKLAKTLYEETGYDEIGLLSLSSSDYSGIDTLTGELVDDLQPKNVNISLPSLRLDSFDFSLMEKISATRKAGLTFAPEAGTQRLRDVINKNISEKDLLTAARIALGGGWNRLKLYFMLGLPTETDEDVQGIADLTYKLLEIHSEISREEKLRRPQITVSTAMFIPKAFTPFQWLAQIDTKLMAERQKQLASALKSKVISYQWHDFGSSVIEAVLARGDRRLGEVLFRVWQSGAYRESWREGFSFTRWQEAFASLNLDISFYTGERQKDDILPWDHIDVGVTKEYLWEECEKALRGETTPECREECGVCGAQTYGCGVCVNEAAAFAPVNAGSDRQQVQLNSEADRYIDLSAVNADTAAEIDPEPIQIRLEYSRKGPAAWLGHLDMMRTMERLIRRAGVPVAWSEGFNPRPQIVFALPAGVGVELEADICELTLQALPTLDLELIPAALNNAAPRGIAFNKIQIVTKEKPSLMAQVREAQYRFYAPGIGRAVSDLFGSEGPLMVTRHGKKGTREIDIRPLLLELLACDDDMATIRASAGSAANLRPDLFLQALCKATGYPEEKALAARIVRQCLVLQSQAKTD